MKRFCSWVGILVLTFLSVLIVLIEAQVAAIDEKFIKINDPFKPYF